MTHVTSDASTVPPPPVSFPGLATPDGGFQSGKPAPIADPPLDLGAACDPTRAVKANGPALIVQDPGILSRFSLDRVLRQIASTTNDSSTPVELLQRLFDTENTDATGVFPDVIHCDGRSNSAFSIAGAVDCPRAEAVLAKRTGFFTAGDPDAFSPVAIVNRFDLMPTSFATCGEARIVYAKESGKADPNDRVFLIFEAAILNSSRKIAACRPVAEFWASLESSADPGSLLDGFFFRGISGFEPAIHADHYGLNQGNCAYSGNCGQIRIGQGMQAPFEFRQFQLSNLTATGTPPRLRFDPVPVSNSPDPALFDPGSKDPNGPSFRTYFARNPGSLLATDVTRVRAPLRLGMDTGESAVSGAAMPNFATRALGDAGGDVLAAQIAATLSSDGGLPCPATDPVTPASVLNRLTATTCAGCHAPDQLLPSGGAVGCGMTWPKSLGTTHFDEQGALSDALTHVFLPHRADVLATFLRACDQDAIRANLEPIFQAIPIECFTAGTPVAMADGSEKAIERVVPGDRVLGFDRATRALAPAEVRRVVVRTDADRLIVVNGSLHVTPNHRFVTERGLVRAESLSVGDVLVRVRDGAVVGERLDVEPREVLALSLEPGFVDTYNIETSDHHDYFAGGYLVDDRP